MQKFSFGAYRRQFVDKAFVPDTIESLGDVTQYSSKLLLYRHLWLCHCRGT